MNGDPKFANYKPRVEITFESSIGFEQEAIDKAKGFVMKLMREMKQVSGGQIGPVAPGPHSIQITGEELVNRVQAGTFPPPPQVQAPTAPAPNSVTAPNLTIAPSAPSTHAAAIQQSAGIDPGFTEEYQEEEEDPLAFVANMDVSSVT